MLCIINYGSGNIAAITNICQREQIEYKVASSYQDIKNADHYLLPGVGAFDPTINTLDNSGILKELEKQVKIYKKPLLGICIGMHLLANISEEGKNDGLGWIPGRVTKIKTNNFTGPPYLPHMGWNEISGNCDDPMLRGLDMKQGFYFLHSYFFDANESENVIATVKYGLNLPCIVRKGNIVGAQFHPEKSHSNGVTFIKNFIGLN